jgi:hypothetical protein
MAPINPTKTDEINISPLEERGGATFEIEEFSAAPTSTIPVPQASQQLTATTTGQAKPQTSYKQQVPPVKEKESSSCTIM